MIKEKRSAYNPSIEIGWTELRFIAMGGNSMFTLEPFTKLTFFIWHICQGIDNLNLLNLLNSEEYR